MKVWLYYRLSRDEDDELNSLTNQRKIIYGYAVSNGHEVVGESFDDNISGMHFNRPGIDKIYEAVEQKQIEAIIVKDLSRLGRHRTQTAIFIDYLREHNVRVLSATEGIDTCNENDDLIVGFKGLVNDFYAKDISKKIRSGYRQKQKEGIVITPPFGYFKDKNTGSVVIVEEAAQTVREIFSAYLSGVGLKTIARQLNEERRKTPAQMQLELLRKRMPDCYDHALGRKTPMQIHNGRRGRDIQPSLWTYASVKNILRAEACAGVLVNHSSEHRNGKKLPVPADEQLRHESYFPALVSRAEWEEVQRRLDEQTGKNKKRCFLETTDGAAANKPNHRYAGLLHCAACALPSCR